jgi:2'-5' RNA ligase
LAEVKLKNLFFALWPDPEARDALVRLQQNVPGQNGRLQHPDDLHMTLVFLGKVPPEQVDCVRKVAAGVVARSFSLELNMVGYWQKPRILWCAPDNTPEPLNQLVYDLQQGLVACGVQPEKRPYAPHVTLMRKAAVVVERFLDESVVWAPREFVLARSDSGLENPRYRVLNRWNIR